MSSSQPVTARFESVDKENVTRYGISMELQVTEKFKEFVLPMPPGTLKTPVFPYSIQMFKFKYGEFIGEKFENIAPIQTEDIWTHKTVTDRIGISIFTSLRFECLPRFYGSNCQFYCAPGEECAKEECGKIKCENEFPARMPKGGATSLIPVYAGLREDLDMFLKAFLDIRSQRFSDYKRLFQQREMMLLHNGRSDSAEIIEFNEHLLVSCLPYMEEKICPGTPRCLEERLFGLYCLYTFFYTQAAGHVVKIRIDPDSSRNFRQFTQLLLELKIYDAYMACLKLCEDKAFKYVAFLQVFDPSQFKRFGAASVPKPPVVLANVNDPFARVKALLSTDLFQKINVIHKEYTKMKSDLGINLGGEKMKNAYDELKNNLLTHQEAYKLEKSVIPSAILPIITENPLKLRTEIKEKAYSADLHLERSRRHYTTDELEVTPQKFDFEPTKQDVKEEMEDEDWVPKSLKKKRSPAPKPAPKRKRARAQTPKLKLQLPKLTGRRTNNSIASELFAVPSESETLKTEATDVEEVVEKKEEKDKLPGKMPKSILKRRADDLVEENPKYLNDEEANSDIEEEEPKMAMLPGKMPKPILKRSFMEEAVEKKEVEEEEEYIGGPKYLDDMFGMSSDDEGNLSINSDL
ncbi:hypothetical protein CAEBREN_00872 [Caenorhabditis brenneri]|uniref:Uncharacterized protein n=1 Tax=Caenorhabditis brenneri TaxID=135651 RepID=G0NE14_CAEBE|nr:hypothetical protein CAEBREN_00872 [Caenorhabditis brenneri]